MKEFFKPLEAYWRERADPPGLSPRWPVPRARDRAPWALEFDGVWGRTTALKQDRARAQTCVAYSSGSGSV